MSKPIALTDDMIAGYAKEFIANLRKTKMFDGNLSYSKSIVWKAEAGVTDRAKIMFEPYAYTKMIALIQACSKEVGWHGVIRRSEDDDETFIVTDIIVFPQVVSGATVIPDQQEYQKWMCHLPDEQFKGLRFHGHSHVNMAVSPSPTDNDYQEKLIQQVPDDSFYVFMIWNKRMETFSRIFDLKNNTMYENAEIDIGIVGDGDDLSTFVTESKKLVKDEKPATTLTPAYAGSHIGKYVDDDDDYYGGAYGGAYGGGYKYPGSQNYHSR